MARTALSAAASSSTASYADSASCRRRRVDSIVTVCNEFASSSIVFLILSFIGGVTYSRLLLIVNRQCKLNGRTLVQWPRRGETPYCGGSVQT